MVSWGERVRSKTRRQVKKGEKGGDSVRYEEDIEPGGSSKRKRRGLGKKGALVRDNRSRPGKCKRDQGSYEEDSILEGPRK